MPEMNENNHENGAPNGSPIGIGGPRAESWWATRLPQMSQVQKPIDYPGVKIVRSNSGEIKISVFGLDLPLGKGGPGVASVGRHVWTQWDAEAVRDLTVALKLGFPVLWPGDAGIGKTASVRFISALFNRSLQSVTCHGAMEADDLVAKISFGDTKSGFLWADGPAVKAAVNGEILVLEEFDQMPPKTQIRLHDFLDACLRKEGNILLTEKDGSLCKVHPDFRVMALYNPPSAGNIDRYIISEALYSRFVVFHHKSKVPREVAAIRMAEPSGERMVEYWKGRLAAMEAINYQPLAREQFLTSPKFEGFVSRYLKFREELAEAVNEGEVGAEQGQPVFITPRSDSRVIEYICELYSGDMEETIQRALQFEFVNKFASAEERESVASLAREVVWDKVVPDEHHEETSSHCGTKQNVQAGGAGQTLARPPKTQPTAKGKKQTTSAGQPTNTAAAQAVVQPGQVTSQAPILQNQAASSSATSTNQAMADDCVAKEVVTWGSRKADGDIKPSLQKVVALGVAAIQPLLAAMHIGDEQAARRIGSALKLIGAKHGREVWEEAKKAISADIQENTKRKIIEALPGMGVRPQDGIPLLCDLIGTHSGNNTSNSVGVRVSSLSALGDFGGEARGVLSRIEPLLKDANPKVQQAAAFAIRQIQNKLTAIRAN